METKRLTSLSMLLTLTLILTIIESFIVLPVSAVGVKLGLANIIVMFTLVNLDSKSATLMMVIKSLFVFVTKGFSAFLVSFGGGVLALLVMIIIWSITKKKVSFVLLSVSGALSFNIGQIIMAVIIYNSFLMVYYLPILLISGFVTGFVTGLLLVMVSPSLRRIKF